MSDLEQIMRSALSRRTLLTRMGVAGVGAAALPILAGCEGGGSTTANPNGNNGNNGGGGTTFFDPANFPNIPGRSYTETVLNYAYLLEVIEAELYRQALNLAAGRPAGEQLSNNIPAAGSLGGYSLAIPAGNIAAQFVQPAFLYLVQYAFVERAHRDFLQSALTSIGATLPTTNPNGYTANFGSPVTLQSILELIYAVEETGVRAYLGAAPFMDFASDTDKQFLTTAVAIHSTEARHSAAVAYVLGKPVGPTFLPGDRNVVTGQVAVNTPSEDTFQYYLLPPAVLQAVSAFNRP